MITLKEGIFALKLAREAVTTFIKSKKQIDPPREFPKEFKEKGGVFVTLKTYKIIYSQQSNWNLDSTTGNVNIFIYQDSNMNSNVTGTADTTTGNVKLEYEDTSSLVGAFYTADVDTGDIDYHNLGGFSEQFGGFGSDDYFTAINSYTLDLGTTTGNIDIYGKSI